MKSHNNRYNDGPIEDDNMTNIPERYASLIPDGGTSIFKTTVGNATTKFLALIVELIIFCWANWLASLVASTGLKRRAYTSRN